MQGTILTFSRETSSGLISGNDGCRYKFAMADWTSSPVYPKEGYNVDFEIDGQKAHDIIVIKNAFKSEKNRIVAALLAFFMGGFGVHRFYLHQTAWGILYLVFFWTLIPSIVALIDGIRFLLMDEDTFEPLHNTY